MIHNKVLLENFQNDTMIKLYHLNIFENKQWLKNHFGDVKIVCMGGKSSRMRELATLWRQKSEKNGGKSDIEPYDYSIKGDRYSMFKENQVIFLSHGMGIPSISIALNEVTKLLHFAGVSDAIYIRIGTCGGLNLSPGTLVVTEQCFDAGLHNYLEMFICGKSVKRPAILDKTISEEFVNLSEKYLKKKNKWKIIKANTLCTNDFYEEQARLDGAFNKISEEDQKSFLQILVNKYNIRNIEMESLGFAAFCHNLNIKSVVVALCVVDRLLSDFITMKPEEVALCQENMNEILIHFLENKLNMKS